MTEHTSNLGVISLKTYYWRLMILGSLAFLLLVGWTVWTGWQRQYTQEINLANQRIKESSIHLKSIIKAATDHLEQIENWATRFPNHTPYSGPYELGETMKQAIELSADGEFTLDALSALPPEQRLGQMLGLTEADYPHPADQPSQLDLGLSLLGRMDDARKTSPFLRWSYFFSADKHLLAVTPWASSQEMLNGEVSIRNFLFHSWQYDITKLGLPENNPKRQFYWTPAYPDQAGAGLMVSYGAPIYWNNTFIGIVGTDVLLNFLGDFLHGFPDSEGVLLIVNEHGQILGNRQHNLQQNKEIPLISDVLPKGITWPSIIKSHGEQLGDNHVFVATIDNPQWHIVYLLPQSVVTWRVIYAYTGPFLLAVLLIVAAFAMQWALWRMYVAPALHITYVVAAESEGCQLSASAIPQQWQPWIQKMVQAFNDRRRYLFELQASHEALEERVAARTKELLLANQQLEKLSITDPLTGAFNRRYLFDLLTKEQQRIHRGGESMSVLLIDLDHFKRINDQFGHAAGDAVLREFVKRSQHTVRMTDAVCRYGGEEFVIFLPSLSCGNAAILAERIRSVVADTPFESDGLEIPVTTSIGVAEYRNAETIEGLLSRADQLLYHAKKTGRNRVVIEDTY